MTKHDLVRLTGVGLALWLMLWAVHSVQTTLGHHYTSDLAHNAPWVALNVALNLLACLPFIALGNGALRRWGR